MKSYFAKLAARATLANAPVAKPVNPRRAADPFETTVTSSEATPRAAPSPAIRSSNQAPAKPDDVSKLSSRTVELQPPKVTHAPKTSTPVAPHVTEVQQSIIQATSIPEPRPSRPDFETRKSARGEAQDLNVNSKTRADSLSPEAQRSSQEPPPTSAKKREKSRSPDDDNVNERLSSIESEQAILLRKADAFMAGLFERRDRASDEAEGDDLEDQGQHRAVRSETAIQAPTRLQPTPAPARVSEPAAQEPSVVIGKLSVEIVPTPPPAITPQSQVVVIGGGRKAKGGIPSAHRFGFSRY